MRIFQTRRDFLASLSAAGAVSARGARSSLADQGPPETTTIRIRVRMRRHNGGWVAKPLIAPADRRTAPCGGLHRHPLCADVRRLTVPHTVRARRDRRRPAVRPGAVRLEPGCRRPDHGVRGCPSGCFKLFAHEPIRAFGGLKGKQVGCTSARLGAHMYVAIMAAQVGLDPQQDIDWMSPRMTASPSSCSPRARSMRIWASRRSLRSCARAGSVACSSTWPRTGHGPSTSAVSCSATGTSSAQYPVATKRGMRAILKATDLCATEPERAARQLIEAASRSATKRAPDDHGLPYDGWRELDPEDTMRFFGLRLHEFGHDQLKPQQAHRRGHRLALPQRAQARTEGVSVRVDQVDPAASKSQGSSDADHSVARALLAPPEPCAALGAVAGLEAGQDHRAHDARAAPPAAHGGDENGGRELGLRTSFALARTGRG